MSPDTTPPISGPFTPSSTLGRPLQQCQAKRDGPPRATLVFSLFVLFCGLAAYATLYGTGHLATPDRSDGLCHYVYLPAWVVHHDASFKAVADAQFGGRFPADLQISWRPGTGRWLNAHQMGVAVMCLPFYLAGHGISKMIGVDADASGGTGFSAWERHAAGVAGIFYLAAGLWLLGRLLSRHFTRPIVLVTLVCVTFGTNLFHYATYDSLWSHVFSFFLFAAFLNVVAGWTSEPSYRLAVLAGLVGGLIGLVRLPNLAFLVFFALYGVNDRASLAVRVRLLRRQWRQVVLAGTTCAVVVLPQLLIFTAARFVVGQPLRAVLATFRHPSRVQLRLASPR